MGKCVEVWGKRVDKGKCGMKCVGDPHTSPTSFHLFPTPQRNFLHPSSHFPHLPSPSLHPRAGGTAPRTPRTGGLRPGQGPRPEHRGFFLLGNDFNRLRVTMQHQFVCVRVCRKVRPGGRGEFEKYWTPIAPLLLLQTKSFVCKRFI